MIRSRLGFSLCVLCVLCGESSANPPTASYIFPAGGQRGTAVQVRVGGLFLHDSPQFRVVGPGVTHSPTLAPVKRLWFEGPLLPLPESQQQEDYPADLTGRVTIAENAAAGARRVQVFTAQGGASGPVFMVGELPEVIEQETDGDALPGSIRLPVTANGRIFPREDVDLWEFDAEAGKTVTAFVHAQSLNSPLAPQLDILDVRGNVVAEQMPHPCVGTDASVKFTPKASGMFRVRITDARSQGGQAYVYRLTVTTADVAAFHFPLKAPQDGLRDVTERKEAVAAPVAINGRVTKPGDLNEWKVTLRKGLGYTFDLQAHRFGSPLCAAVSITDPAGKKVGSGEAGVTTDPGPISVTPPEDGTYTVRVAERFRGRGGPEFVYRLRVFDAATAPAPEPGLRLRVTADVFTVPRGGGIKVKVNAERTGFAGPVVMRAMGLPKGLTAPPVLMPANQNSADFTISTAADAAVGHHPLRIEGVAVAGPLTRFPSSAVFPGAGLVPDSAELRLAVSLPTPFKIIDQYVMTAAPRGEIYRRKYKVERGGFDGPIQIQLADKQARHLQGVTGPVLTLKQGETEFEYPAFLPPWMELGRTCRVCVMATAKVKDPVDGREHTVSFSSVEQNQQMIVVVTPGRLDVALEKTSIRAEPGGDVRLAVRVSRSKSLTGPVKVEAVIPEHWKGVTASPLTIPTDGDAGELVLRFAGDCGLFNAPLVVRATVETPATPVVAEAKVEVVR